MAILTNDFNLDIAKGTVYNKSHIHKFGHNGDIAADVKEDVWTAGGTYVFPSDSGESIECVSDNALDTGISFTIQGLDENFESQMETVTLNGTTAVAVPGTWTRVFRAYTNDSTEVQGTVSVQAAGGGTVYAQVLAAEQQTQMAIYTIPAGYEGYLVSFYATANRKRTTGAADVHLMVRDFGKVFLEKEHLGLQVAGQSFIQYRFEVPLKYKAKTDIKLAATPTTGGIDIAAGFDLILVKSTKT